ncbi:protein regulator of cytokinesis 1 [Copidosoma floridanum]|uniref:protein regulator of cytokinesis 1 n=1 Tax=Copidosoma floridanum TaxID=29053 RepID=UPI0006C9C262|nr:protein regulator of cytokinesis 1 [Copidosoma floridanum]
MPKAPTSVSRRREPSSRSTGLQDDQLKIATTITAIRENTIQNVVSVCQKQINVLFNIWEETGIKHEVLGTYADQVTNHVVGLMKDMVDESDQRKKDLLKNVKILAQSARKLSKELGTNFETEAYSDLPLIEMEDKLNNEVLHLQKLKDKRKDYIQELEKKEIELCKKMGTNPNGFARDFFSEEEIHKFENHLNSQESEMNRLSEVFEDTKRSILKMMEKLEIVPVNDFESLVCHNHSNFIYTSNNMTKLRDLRERLKNQVKDAKMQVEEKTVTLIALWDYLDEPEEKRKAFLMKNSGYSIVTLNSYDTEIKRCREKISENVANYVQNIRKEIENLWKLCRYGELQKKSFTAMKCQTYTEDLLLLHEMEAEKLRKYYNTNRKIFELLTEWEVQFEKLKELDQRANDPDRYHNRGGQLLLEEKERKAAEKKIPKLENQLYDAADEYENTTRKPFLIDGYSMREYMNHAKDNYDTEKENMKLARKQAKDRSIKKTPLSTSKRTPGASMLRVTPASGRFRTPINRSRFTPLAKRKLPYDASPEVTVNKKRAVGSDKSKTTVLCNKLRRSVRTPEGRISNVSGKVRKSTSKKKKSKNETILSVSAYGSFQDHLEDRPELRSSVLPTEIKSTQMKTPSKPARKKVLALSTPSAPNSIPRLRSTPRNPQLLTVPKFNAA